MRWLAALPVCMLGCGDNLVPAAPDAAPPMVDAFVACTAQLTGNFIETITTSTRCAAFVTNEDDGNLSLQIQLTSHNLVEPYVVGFEVELMGDFSSQTVTKWSSTAMRSLPHDTCVLAAGGQFIPPGVFTLHLDSSTHGTLVLDQPIHATAFSDCGNPLVEHFEVTF